MEPIVNKIHLLLIKRGKTVAVSESCTGGLLSKLLTDLSGSSAYFICGIVTYSNKAKISLLGVPKQIIARKGAVSKETAVKMAQNVRKIAKSDFGISVTGIAGPSGSTPQKPIGTVYIALAAKNKTICKKFIFNGNRGAIRRQSAQQALRSFLSFI